MNTTTKNYYELIQYIESVCTQHPMVNSFFYGVYLANETPDICYGAIILTSDNINTTATLSQYSFNLMYVDKLMADRSNVVNIQSEALDTIKSILGVVASDFDVIDYEQLINLRLFTDQFADGVAGAVGQIEISLPSNIGECTWYDYCKKC